MKYLARFNSQQKNLNKNYSSLGKNANLVEQLGEQIINNARSP